jgi:hypothetical protein
MLGIGSAGTILSIRLREGWLKTEDVSSKISTYAMLAGISIVFSYIISNLIPFDPVKLSWEKTQIFYIALYCLILSIPFFFSGILIATAFSVLSKRAEFIYSSDLIGAGVGSIAVLALLNIAGPEYAVFSASTLCFIGAIISGVRHIRFLAISFIVFNIIISLVHPEFIDVRISPYKRLSISLKYPGAEHLKTYHSPYSRIDIFKSPAVRFAPGLSLKYLDPLPEQIGLSIDGDRINAVTDANDSLRLRFLRFLPSAIAYEIGRKDKVLILEPKGGLHVLMAEYYDSVEIHKIESNPMLIKVLKENFREFSGGIFEHYVWTGYGRNWLRDSGSYDIIDLSMTGTSVSGVFGISEDYRFTVEAFKEYLSALRRDGIMSVTLYLIPPPRAEFRLLTTIFTALEEMGIRDITKMIAAIRSWDVMTILIKTSPFIKEEIKHIKDFARSRQFDLVYYPGIKEAESNIYIRTPSNEYFKGFKSLLGPYRSSFINNYLFDIKPVYDENPFFHYYLRLKNIKAIYKVMGQKWLYFIEEGYLLPVILLIVLILSLIMILLPVFLKTIYKESIKDNIVKSLLSPTLFYFAMLGLGFMFVEVTFIQKTILSLENPTYTVAVVLTAILTSSGLGSMCSARVSRLRTPYLLLLLACLIFIYSLMHPFLLNSISSYPLKLKVLIIFVTLMPLGFFMGIPFPMGIKVLGERNERLIPWAWAINACLSVLTPILTIMLAIVFGFKTVLWFGTLAYLFAFVSLKRLMTIIRKENEGTGLRQNLRVLAGSSCPEGNCGLTKRLKLH